MLAYYLLLHLPSIHIPFHFLSQISVAFTVCTVTAIWPGTNALTLLDDPHKICENYHPSPEFAQHERSD